MALFNPDIFLGKLYAGKLFSFNLNPILEQVSSGVRRLWLAELTAKLNGMWEEAPAEVKEKLEKAPKLEKVLELSDGSAIIGEPSKKAKRVTVAKEKEVPKRIPKVHVKQYNALPPVEYTALFIFTQFQLMATNNATDLAQEVEVLREQVYALEEEALLLTLLA